MLEKKEGDRMKTIQFACCIVNIEKIGYLSKGYGTGVIDDNFYVSLLVDGVELKEWFNEWSDSYKRYEELKSILEMY